MKNFDINNIRKSILNRSMFGDNSVVSDPNIIDMRPGIDFVKRSTLDKSFNKSNKNKMAHISDTAKEFFRKLKVKTQTNFNGKEPITQ